MVSPTDFDRGLLNSRGLPLPPGPSLLWPRVSDIKLERLRTAASDLGKVYNALRKEDQSLGEWALSTKRTHDTGEPIIGYQLGNALEKAFAPEPDPQERFWRYADALEIATSEIAPKAVDWAKQALKDQKDTLVALKQEINKAEFAEWMHQAAKEITQSSAACRDAAASRAHSEFMQEHQGNPLPDRDLYTAEQSWKLQRSVQECWTQATKSFVEKEKGGKAAQAGYIDLLRILLFHQKYIDILNAYEQKPAQGTALAKTLIDDSLGAIDKFSAGLTAKKIWHYVAAVQGAVEALKLNDVSGFSPFMQNISAQLAKDPVDDILSILGMGLFFVSLIAGVGVGFMVADVILNGASAWFSYLRNHEQELAARSSAFLPDESRFASGYGYGDTTLAAIFAFISVASLLRPAAKALKSARAKPVVPEGAPLRKAPPAPSAGTAKESKLVGDDAAALKNKALGDKATTGAQEPAGRATKVPVQPTAEAVKRSEIAVTDIVMRDYGHLGVRDISDLSKSATTPGVDRLFIIGKNEGAVLLEVDAKLSIQETATRISDVSSFETAAKTGGASRSELLETAVKSGRISSLEYKTLKESIDKGLVLEEVHGFGSVVGISEKLKSGQVVYRQGERFAHVSTQLGERESEQLSRVIKVTIVKPKADRRTVKAVADQIWKDFEQAFGSKSP